jgi:copper chaperone
MSTKQAKVPNISCGHCVSTIERELADLPGVESVRADAVTRTVEVRWDESVTDWSAVAALLDEIDYPVAD